MNSPNRCCRAKHFETESASIHQPFVHLVCVNTLKSVHLGLKLSISIEPLPVIRRLFFPSVVFLTVQSDPPTVGILLKKSASSRWGNKRHASIHASKTINQPLKPVNTGECRVPQTSNHRTHNSNALRSATASVIGSQLRSLSALAAFSRSSRKSPPAQSGISQITA